MPPVETQRVFIALPVSESLRAALERTQSELQRLLPPAQFRWTRPDQFHITLKFLGDVEINRLNELCGVVRSACGKFSPIKLNAESVGAFPSLRAPRVLWIGVSGDTQLARLQSTIEQAVLPFAEAKPEKKFFGHITLARIKEHQGRPSRIVTDRIRALSSAALGSWTVCELKVMRSKLSEAGATHEDVAVLTLGAQNGG